MPTLLSGRILIGSISLALCLGWHAAAQAEPPVDSGILPPAEEEEANKTNADASDLDSLLEMADKDVGALGNVNVATATDPLVEGVSKKEETLSESPAVAQVITQEEIRAFGAKNLFEVLNWATSVYTTGSYLYPDNKVAIRGDCLTHNDIHTLVLINGRPFRDYTQSGHNSPVYLAFPLDAIHHIEIIRGPGSVLYGSNAYTGVINVVTIQPDGPTGRGAVLAGDFGTQLYDLTQGNGTKDKDSGYLVSATYGRQKGWPFTATGEGPPSQVPVAIRDTTDRGHDQVGVFGQIYSGNLTANVFVANLSQTHMGAVPRWPAEDIDSQAVQCDIGYLLEHWDDSTTDLHFTYNLSLFDWDRPVRNEFSSNSYIGEITHYRTVADGLDLTVGAYFDIHDGAVTDGAGGILVPAFSQIWYAVYGQLEYTMTDWLKLIGGVQGNFPGEIEPGLAPRAGAILTLSENWGAKLLYGKAFRSPYPAETSINAPGILVGNPDLVPETVDTYEAQLAYTTDQTRVACTYFFSQFNDVIGRIGALPATFDNLDPIKFQGVELESSWDPNPHWHYLGAVTWQQNVDSQGRFDTTHVPNWMGKVGVAYDTCDGLKFGIFDVIFSRPDPVTVVNPGAAIVNTPESAINLLSLDVRYDVSRYLRLCHGRKAELEFLVQNLLDDDINHPEFSRRRINTLPADGGRAFYGGFSIEY